MLRASCEGPLSTIAPLQVERVKEGTQECLATFLPARFADHAGVDVAKSFDLSRKWALHGPSSTPLHKTPANASEEQCQKPQ